MTQVARIMGSQDNGNGSAPESSPGESRSRAGSGTHRIPPRPADSIILVVDDDEDVREAVSSALDEEGYRVVVARNGADALDVIRTAPPPHLIVLDLTMPRMTGTEFRRRLSAELPDVKAPVVVMSADVEGRAKARSMGAAAFLQKPIRLKELFHAVDVHLRRARGEVEPRA